MYAIDHSKEEGQDESIEELQAEEIFSMNSLTCLKLVQFFLQTVFHLRNSEI
jgi:hypothetical protein